HDDQRTGCDHGVKGALRFAPPRVRAPLTPRPHPKHPPNYPLEIQQRLDEDIRRHYHARFSDLNGVYRGAWDQAVLNRLDAMQLPGAMRREFAMFRHALRARMAGANLKLHFGQMRVSPNFQGAQNVNQQVIGFPDQIIGSNLQIVAGDIRNGNILGDQIPLQIFYKDNKWIAANNRCLTAYCFALVRPLRLIPRLPDQLEINRLYEKDGRGDISNFSYLPAVSHLKKSPRTLPSDQMPVITGPATWIVQSVATIPGHWR
ncbi:MAG: hypothetical protein ACK6DI_13470, partial [Betaproteobacteria bacterium]